MFDDDESVLNDHWRQSEHPSNQGTIKTISMNPLTSGTTLNEFVSTRGKSPMKDIRSNKKAAHL